LYSILGDMLQEPQTGILNMSFEFLDSKHVDSECRKCLRRATIKFKLTSTNIVTRSLRLSNI